MAIEDEDLNDLEREIDETAQDDGPQDDEFMAPDDEQPERDPEPETEPEQEQPVAAQPQIADDLDAARAHATEIVQQWGAYLGSTEQALADARKALVEADDIDKPAAERVAAQEALHQAILDQREAKAGMERARQYHENVSRPRAPAVQGWIDANPRFKTDAAFRERASKIAAQLEQEGLNPSHPRMYQELDKRLRTKPAMGSKSGNRSAPAPATRQPERGRSSGDLSPSAFDSKWMPKIGLNPNNKAHLKEWKKNYNDLAAEA